MASRFLVAVAFFAVCHSSIVDVTYRDRRSFTNAEGYAEGVRGANQASAAVDGRKTNAYGITSDGGKALAKVNVDENPVNSYINIGQAQPAYYHVPAPVNVVTYQKNYEVPAEVRYELPQEAPSAQSTAVINGGYGSANSNANVNNGLAASNARTQGSGFGSASSLAQSTGFVNPIPNNDNIEHTIVAAKNQGLRYAYNTPGAYNSAISNANVHGQGSASSYAGAIPTRKSISWHFGTAYDYPAGYAKSSASNYGYGSASANSDVNASQGSVRSNTNVQGGSGSAQSIANNGAGYSSAKSAVNGGTADANAIVTNTGYTVLRSAENNAVMSTANSYGQGSARSSAITNTGAHGLRSTGWGGRTASDAHSSGPGYAASYAKDQDSNKVVNSIASSSPYGSAGANAYSI